MFIKRKVHDFSTANALLVHTSPVAAENGWGFTDTCAVKTPSDVKTHYRSHLKGPMELMATHAIKAPVAATEINV